MASCLILPASQREVDFGGDVFVFSPSAKIHRGERKATTRNFVSHEEEILYLAVVENLPVD